MEKQKSTLDAILKQYEDNSKPKTKGGSKTYDLANYFSIFLEKGVKSGKKTIRILPPAKDGDTPFTELYIHSKEVDGKTRKFACLKEMYDKDCPFCDAREELYASGEETDKELAKKYFPRRTYVCRIVDRDAEDQGVKFWRFNHDFRNQGTFDKIIAIVSEKGDITHPETGRDLVIHIGRDQNDNCIIKSITYGDPAPISEDKEQAKAWVENEKAWEDVYSVKPYDYLEIIVKGGIPVWDKATESFVDKASLEDHADGSENDKLNEELADEHEIDATDVKDEEGDDLPF